MSEKITTVYMVRHGTTALNERLCSQGWYDEPLNDVGLEQGALLYDYFKDIPIDVGYTSPLKRAAQTMECLLGDREVPVVADDDLREIHFGDLEGRPFAEINAFFPGTMATFLRCAGALQNPNGESGEETYNRVVNGVRRIVAENLGRTIVMTYHGFALQCWLNYVQGISAAEMKEQCVDNVSVCKFIFDDQLNVTTEYIGDNHHLPERLRVNYHWEDIPLDQPLLLHYSKCSTCQKAKKFLNKAGVDYMERDLVTEPLHASEISALMDRYKGEERHFFNTSGIVYRELGLKDFVPNMTPEDMALWLATDGKLVKRPILVLPDQVLIGFKQNNWDAALKQK